MDFIPVGFTSGESLIAIMQLNPAITKEVHGTEDGGDRLNALCAAWDDIRAMESDTSTSDPINWEYVTQYAGFKDQPSQGEWDRFLRFAQKHYAEGV